MLVGHQYRSPSSLGAIRRTRNNQCGAPYAAPGSGRAILENRQRARLHGVIEACALQIDRLTVRTNEPRRERGSSTSVKMYDGET